MLMNTENIQDVVRNSADEMDGTFISGLIRAAKPAAATCCGPSCCR